MVSLATLNGGWRERLELGARRLRESFRHPRPTRFRIRSVNPRTPAFIPVAVIIFFLLFRSARVVPAGHVGVVDLFGNVRSEALPSGLHLVNPLARVHR